MMVNIFVLVEYHKSTLHLTSKNKRFQTNQYLIIFYNRI